ncbi:hypothetical protein BaRGS_00023998, partial [Batillaria attramentaria]
METYLQRLYLNKRDEEEAPKYPVWDYRALPWLVQNYNDTSDNRCKRDKYLTICEELLTREVTVTDYYYRR